MKVLSRALCLISPAPAEASPLSVVEREVPQPGRGEVRVRVLACGVCHTDLHVVEGDLPPHRSPLVPGHQIVGTVERLGDGVDPPLLGRRVGITWLGWACGECAACLRGEENLCPRARFTGYDLDGGFAQHAMADAGFVVPIPDRFGSLEAAPLLCAGAIGYRSLRVAGLCRGERLGLYGFGASAHLAIQLAVSWGCEVGVVTRGTHHRVLAEELGASWVGTPGTLPPRLFDRAVVFAPSGDVVLAALEAVRPGGTVAINAVTLDRIPQMPYSALYGERILRSVSNLTRADAVEFLRAAAEIGVRTRFEAFPLESANKALLRLKQRELAAAAVLEIA